METMRETVDQDGSDIKSGSWMQTQWYIKKRPDVFLIWNQKQDDAAKAMKRLRLDMTVKRL